LHISLKYTSYLKTSKKIVTRNVQFLGWSGTGKKADFFGLVSKLWEKELEVKQISCAA